MTALLHYSNSLSREFRTPNSVDAMAHKRIDKMKEKKGKMLEQWLKIVAKTKIEKHVQIIKHLRA